ncbi:MAG: DUF2203 domain-containing protein [Thermogemmatispora sp.]|jgi:hypothetical protein|uniref:DUF2203 domain-containing protein n=1 Tax=Thermogemmatispora aurantia TaxID=2045279 RepID=A0A5J4K9F5_9CHLR|nr:MULTISPECIES: DUF2203 domain-containing protein [Thermogemmatispora]MBE3566804.1 DUF2203 domain-containing protein [Thermogemmatispora sp.]GER83320.1 hypothetical protein KTAU_19570 [Thermogemmatispora aurantia]
MPHYFTREEAEALLPVISPILRHIQEQRRRLREGEERAHAIRLRIMKNGHNINETMMEIQREQVLYLRRLQEALEKLNELGCELKDPDMGLVDFLSLREGREVYLCWHLGEERIKYWHPLDTGFQGRRPLDEEERENGA